MRKFNKIEQTKNKQSVEVTQPILSREVPFYKWLKNAVGYLLLMVNRPFIIPSNLLVWGTEVGEPPGYYSDNTIMASNVWHAIQYTVEYGRGELARLEQHQGADKNINAWVFNAGDTGWYRVSSFIELTFNNQDSADYYSIGAFEARLAINWLPVVRKFGKTDMYRGVTLANRLWGTINDACDIVYLKAGDKLTVHINLAGDLSPEPKEITIDSRIAINYLGKKERKINTEVTTWGLV